MDFLPYINLFKTVQNKTQILGYVKFIKKSICKHLVKMPALANLPNTDLRVTFRLSRGLTIVKKFSDFPSKSIFNLKKVDK